jgi:hypothetical protein
MLRRESHGVPRRRPHTAACMPCSLEPLKDRFSLTSDGTLALSELPEADPVPAPL